MSFSNWVDFVIIWFQQVFAAISLPISKKGFNSGLLNGNSWISSTIDAIMGQHFISESFFLQQSLEKLNIFVYTQAQAIKVHFNLTVVTEVNVDIEGVNYVISARKEVILSAGVFHSLQLLILSGKHFLLNPS